MNKMEFLTTLRNSLTGRVSIGVVNDNVKFYENYIYSEVAKGRTEEEVLQSLGDPRLLAKTIITSQSAEEDRVHTYSGFYDATEDNAYTYQESSSSYEKADRQGSYGRTTTVPMWLVWVIVIAVIVFAIAAIGSILSIVLPIALPLLAVYVIYKFIRQMLDL